MEPVLRQEKAFFMETSKINILILFAHPRFERSRVNRALLTGVSNLPGVTLHDLYEEYPDFNVDAEREKELLLDHQVIIWQHPLYMYGAPALLKQWIDMVLEHGWAHGEGGTNLRGKVIFNALTAGGTRDVYVSGGHGHTLPEFFISFEQTARLCNMVYLPPFVVHGTYLLTDRELEEYAGAYRDLLEQLTKGGTALRDILEYEYLNDWLQAGKGQAAG